MRKETNEIELDGLLLRRDIDRARFFATRRATIH